jgi:general secretion pathway protein A
LNDKLDSSDLVQLKQRVRLRFHLTALSADEMSEYVQHRLNVAGAGDREIFAPDTYPVIFDYTGGIPRLINTLCDTALLAAFSQDKAAVSLEDLRSAIDELQWTEYAARTSTHLQELLDETSPQVQPPVGRIALSSKGVVVTEAYIVPGRFVIGRTSDNDLEIDSRFVSRHHAQILTSVDGSSSIEDLNSTNGIFVAGKRVRRHKLAPNDVVKIGTHEIQYFREDPAPAPDDDDPEEEDDEFEDRGEFARERED